MNNFQKQHNQSLFSAIIIVFMLLLIFHYLKRLLCKLGDSEEFCLNWWIREIMYCIAGLTPSSNMRSNHFILKFCDVIRRWVSHLF